MIVNLKPFQFCEVTIFVRLYDDAHCIGLFIMFHEINSTILVTGGAGFIGSNLIRLLLLETQATIINIDKLTYAGNLDSLKDIAENPEYKNRYKFERVDICNQLEIKQIFEKYRPQAILNLAAESHVDRSIDSPASFIETNILGVFNLLEQTRFFFNNSLNDSEKAKFRFLHVSTDEVFGSLGENGYFDENTSYKPNSPYSASKAASDHLVRAWHHTYGIPTLITNCSNNYGPYQFPEKLIPLNLFNALNNKPIRIYGNGENVRDWIYVEDHCRGILHALLKGEIGESYNIGSNNEKTNLELIKLMCAYLDQISPRDDQKPHETAIAFVTDRPGHDQRYAIDSTKACKELNWKPRETLDSGLKKTIDWYLKNSEWLERIMSGEYNGERIGIKV
jgi:dTDP-glucose 4,6-dehydratase